jgi:hypothetical protein
MALASTIYLSLLREAGLRSRQQPVLPKSALRRQTNQLYPGYTQEFSSQPFFHEFVIRQPTAGGTPA